MTQKSFHKQLYIVQLTDDYEKAKERELKGLSAAMEETGLKSGYIVTSSEEEAIAINGLTITVIPLWNFVLSDFL